MLEPGATVVSDAVISDVRVEMSPGTTVTSTGADVTGVPSTVTAICVTVPEVWPVNVAV
jgi:hypothetical protein